MRIFVALAALTGCLETPTTPGPTGPDEPMVPDSPRVLDGLQVLYTFDEGSGLAVHDKSGVGTALDLNLDNLVSNKWLADGGIDIVQTSVITSTDVASKVFTECVKANAVSLEAWIAPLDATQTGTIFNYGKQNTRNVALAVDKGRYSASVSVTKADPDMPGKTIEAVATMRSPDMMVKAAAQHLVYTRDVNGATIYIDGVDVTTDPMAPAMPVEPSDLTGWSATHQIAVGANSNATSPWKGQVYLAALYCRRLSSADVQKNYDAGY